MIKNEKEELNEKTVSPNDEVASHDAISELFNERDQENLAKRNVLLTESKEDSAQSHELPEEKEKNTKEDVKKVETSNSELDSLQAELEKNRKIIADTKRYGSQNAQRLKNAMKQAKSLVESGTLSEEEAKSLIASLESDGEEETEQYSYDTPFSKILKVANTQLENLRKYSDDDLLDEKIKAFDYFLNMSAPDAVKSVLEELNELTDEPLKLTKKMLSIGKTYYDESYKDIAAAGGFHEFLIKKNEEIAKLNKSIDKLNKKLAQYEDYDQPGYRIREIGDSENVSSEKRDAVSEAFAERDWNDQKRQKRLA
jgi:hypothetical protein